MDFDHGCFDCGYKDVCWCGGICVKWTDEEVTEESAYLLDMKQRADIYEKIFNER